MTRISLSGTTAFRLAMRYAGFVCLLTIACFAVIYWATISQLRTQIDAGLRAETSALTRLYALKGIDGLQQVIAALSTTKGLAASDTGDAGPRQYLLTDSAFKVLAGSLNRWPSGIDSNHMAWATMHIRVQHNQPGLDALHHHFELRAVAVPLPGSYHLLVGQSLDELIEMRDTILGLTIGAVLLILIVGLAGGALVGRSVVRRLQAVMHTADTIMGGDLSQRIPEEMRGDEYDALASKLNAMLARIEQLMKSTREVTENVAHDLRSPLTRLRGRAEIALMKTKDSDHQKAALQKVIEETDGIVATLNAILSIAQIESGARRDWTEVDMSVACRDAAELYEALADEKGVHFDTHITEGIKVRGNRQLLAQAIGNLLDNAIKYTGSGGDVSLSLTNEDGVVVMSVRDSGPGIPAELRDKALQRFVRLDASRSQPGSGLGLSLVKAVAEQHAATLQLEDNHPGLRVSLRFPQLNSQTSL
ncbi:MAG: HAMP domain-containing histidine kinase [Gammaproteobacteria bacterium]|nr:HAMP domain-containing histidine kinase [Gammaproteobacteria bacterium]MDE2345463.1 HAMP domain-containing histidine kinase [Gammaproteobacteria bacterium]